MTGTVYGLQSTVYGSKTLRALCGVDVVDAMDGEGEVQDSALSVRSVVSVVENQFRVSR